MNVTKAATKTVKGTVFSLLMLAFCINPLEAQDVAVQEQSVDKGTITLLVSRDRKITGRFKQIVVGDADIAKVSELPDRSGVIVNGKKEGTTDLRLWPIDEPNTVFLYTIKVSSMDIGQMKEDIKELLGTMYGVEIRVVGERLVVDGTVYRRDDRARVDTIAKEYGLLDLTTNKFSETEAKELADKQEAMEKKIIEQIKADLAKQGLNNIEIELKDVRGQRHLFLNGVVFNDEHLAKAMTIAQIYHKEDAITNLIQVENPIVEIEVQLAEVNQNKAREVGNNNLWNSAMQASIDALVYNSELAEATKPTYTVASGANTALRLLHTNGTTEFYAQQAQSVKSGQLADFNRGGELYFTTTGENPTLAKVEFGFQVEVTPVLKETGLVTMEIHVENSNPVEQVANVSDEAAVSLDTFEQSTIVEVNRGDSLVLSGMDSQSRTKNVSETPFLGKIPIINLFFKEKKGSSSNLRTFLLVTPTYDIKYFKKEVPDITSTAKEDVNKVRSETTTKKFDKAKEADPNAKETVENKFDDVKEKKHPWWKFWKWH